MKTRRTVGEFVLRGASAFRFEREGLCEPVPHLRHLQLSRFKDAIVNTRECVLPTSHRTSLDISAVPFHHKSPGRPHWSCGLDAVGNV